MNYKTTIIHILLSFILASQVYATNSFRIIDIAKQTTNLRPYVIKLALESYQCAKNKKIEPNYILSIIDYSLPSSQKRLWVIDLKHDKILFHTLVSHGKGTGGDQASEFSNKPKSYKSSLGTYTTGKTYMGKNGLSMKLFGLEPGFNCQAHARGIVMHGSNYVSEENIKQIGRLGRSHGCPAISIQDAKPIIETIKNGSLLFVYYPDPDWLKNSTFIKCKN